jgi:hypothetical protein
LAIAFDTYLGDDITELHDQIAHLNGVGIKNYNNFIKEGLFLKTQDYMTISWNLC